MIYIFLIFPFLEKEFLLSLLSSLDLSSLSCSFFTYPLSSLPKEQLFFFFFSFSSNSRSRSFFFLFSSRHILSDTLFIHFTITLPSFSSHSSFAQWVFFSFFSSIFHQLLSPLFSLFSCSSESFSVSFILLFFVSFLSRQFESFLLSLQQILFSGFSSSQQVPPFAYYSQNVHFLLLSSCRSESLLHYPFHSLLLK